MFAEDAITVVEEHAVAVASDAHGVVVTTASGAHVRGERLLVATGRAPRTDDLDLAAAGVHLDGSGFVVVDGQQRTSNPRVFAAGDVTGGPQYVYVAAATGRVAARNAVAPSKPQTPKTAGTTVAHPPRRWTTRACLRSSSPAHSSPLPG